MKNICKNCMYWGVAQAGICSVIQADTALTDVELVDSRASYIYTPEYALERAYLTTGSDFGCIKFKQVVTK